MREQTFFLVAAALSGSRRRNHVNKLKDLRGADSFETVVYVILAVSGAGAICGLVGALVLR